MLSLKKIKFFLPILSVVLLSVIPDSFASNNREMLLFMDIPMVSTATRTSMPASKAPATVVVITKKQIKDRGYNNILDLMKDLPGVDVQDRNGQETYNRIIMRGLVQQEKIIFMMDGHRISSPTGEQIPIAENFPLYNAKQVEIIFGPASALYGADAFAGIINIITRDAEDIDGWEASVSAGNFGYQNHILNYGDRLTKNIKLSAGGHWHEADNADLRKYYDEYKLGDISYDHDDNGATPDLLVTAAERKFEVPTESHSAYIKLDINDTMTLGYSRSFFQHPSDQGALPQQTFFDEENKWETLINNYYLDYHFEDGSSLSGKTSASYLTYEVGPDSKYKDLWNGYLDGYKYAHSKRFKLEQQLNVAVNDENILTGGISYEDFYSLPKTFNLTHPFDPDRSVSDQGYFYRGTDDTIPLKIHELNYTNVAAYLQLQSDLSDTLTATVGARVDDSSRYGSEVNPRCGLVYRPRETTTLKLLYGEAFQAPSPYSSYAGFGDFNGVTDVDGDYTGAWFGLPNQNLKPEKLKSWELGFEEIVSSDLIFNASMFYTEVDDLIQSGDWTFADSTYIEGGKVNPWKRNENMGEAYYWGGELSSDYTAHLDALKLNIWGNYSYLNGRQKKQGGVKTEHNYIAKHKFKAGFTARLGRFYVTPVLHWIGQTNNNRILTPGLDNQKVPSYRIISLNLGVNELTKGLSASVNIKNLLDKRYYNSGAGSATHQSMPQEPRRIVVKLDYKF